MIKLDNEFLREVGLQALSRASRDDFLRHVYDTLESRVGLVLTQMMTGEQLDDFVAAIDADDEAKTLKLLETFIPNYREIVSDELNKLKNEIRTVADEILLNDDNGPSG